MGLDTPSGEQGGPRAVPHSPARAVPKTLSTPSVASSSLALLVHDTLGLYLREMGREPPLSAEQEVSLPSSLPPGGPTSGTWRTVALFRRGAVFAAAIGARRARSF
jgi:hypothetical protein